MSVQANWNLAALDLIEDGDPVQDIMSIAKPIDLSKSSAQLHVELQRLVESEAALADQSGVECELKWQKDHSCYTCAYFEGERDTEKGYLCRLGRRQEDKLEEMDARRALDEAEGAMRAVMLRDECEELADATLPV